MSEAKTERRRWPRIAAADLSGVAIAIVGGPEVSLVNVSRGGVLIEVPARLALRSAVRLVLTEAGRTLAELRGCVVWQKVAAIAHGQINYRIAVTFDEPIQGLDHVFDVERPSAVAPEAGVPLRDNVAPFPAPAAAPVAVPPPVLVLPPAAAAELDELRKQLEAAKADLQCQSAVLESVAARLKDSEHERARLSAHAVEIAARADALQSTLGEQARTHEQSLLEQQSSHEAVVAQLVQANDDQQKDYQELAAQLQAAQQDREAVDAERAEWVARERDLLARLEATELVCTSQRERLKALRRETERLLWTFTAPLRSAAVVGHDGAASDDECEPTAQAG